MPVTHDTPRLTVHRNGQARFNDLARRRYLLGKAAVLLAPPSTIGSRWLLLPVEQASAGALKLHDDRGHKRFGAHVLATSLFALLPEAQKSLTLTLEAGPAGFWLVPAPESAEKHQNLPPLAEAA